MPFMFLPKIMQEYMGLPDHHISYLIGLTLFAAIFFFQKAKARKEVI